MISVWCWQRAADPKYARLMARWSDNDPLILMATMHLRAESITRRVPSIWKRNKTPSMGKGYLTRVLSKPGQGCGRVVTWLILPVVICLSQRLSHACLSINKFVLWNCEWLIKSVIVYLMIPYYMDNCGNSRANTCIKQPRLLGGVYLLDKKPTRLAAPLVIHNNLSNRMALCRRCIIQISALSTFDGRIEAYHGFNG